MELFSLVAVGFEHLYKRPLEVEATAAREEILFLLGTCPFPQGATSAETAALLEKVRDTPSELTVYIPLYYFMNDVVHCVIPRCIYDS